MSKFQIIFIGAFLAIAIFSLLVFADVIHIGGKKAAQQQGVGSVVLWGTLPNQNVSGAIMALNRTAQTYSVVYVQKKQDALEHDLVEALASGKGPDMILFRDDQMLRIKDKLYPFPYTSYSQATFVSSFISEANLLLSPQGILGLPVGVDPLIMYYNQEMFDSANISLPPTTWAGISELIPKLTVHDSSNSSKITKSTVALGTYSNISYAKDIIAALLFQSGQSIVGITESGFSSPLSNGTLNKGAIQAIDFYTSFANPVKSNYSWNSSLRNSQEAFTNGSLAIYFGYASEFGTISKINPNLRFMVAKFPQSGTASNSVTVGKMYSIGILKSSKNISTSFIAASLMSQPEFVTAVTQALHIAPARRDLLLKSPSDSFSQLFYQSALITRGWYDPNREATNVIFRDVIDSVSRGERKTPDAISYLGQSINILLQAIPGVVQ